MKKPVPTIRDVAAAAGVSTATISKFINGTQRFSPAVEARITEVIGQMGYRSNPLAQSMITGKTKTVGLSVLDVANPHFSSIVKGATAKPCPRVVKASEFGPAAGPRSER